MSADPFDSPRVASPGAPTLPRLEPLHLIYEVELAPMGTQLTMLAKNPLVLFCAAMLVGGLVLGLTSGPSWFAASVIGAGLLAWLVYSMSRSPYFKTQGPAQMEVTLQAAGLYVHIDGLEFTYTWADMAYYDESEGGFIAQPRVGATVVFPKPKLDAVAQERLRTWLSHLLTKGSPQAKSSKRSWRTLGLWLLLLVVFLAIYNIIATENAREPGRDASERAPTHRSQ